MDDFSHGWKRKLGCATLMLALAFMGLWLRGLVVGDLRSSMNALDSPMDALDLKPVERKELGPEIPDETVAVLGSYVGRHTAPAKCVAVSPDGRWVATGSRDQSVRLWDPKTLKPIRILKGAADDVNAVAFTTDSESLLAISGDGFLRVWNLDNETIPPQKLPLEHQGIPFMSADGSTIAVHSQTRSPNREEVIRLFTFRSGKLEPSRGPFRGVEQPPECLLLSKSGRWLVGGCVQAPIGEVYLWDLKQKDEKPHSFLTDSDRRIQSVAFSPDETRVLVGRDDGCIVIWELKEPAPVKTIELSAHADDVSAIAFSPDGQKFVSGGYDHRIVVWDWNNGEPTQIDVLTQHKDWIGALAFSPDGNTLYSAGWDHTVRRWTANARTFEPTNAFDGHSHPVLSMAFSKDGKLLATGATSDINVGKGTPNEVRIWRFGDRHPKQQRSLDGCSGWIQDIAFSHDANVLVAASDSGVTCWSVEKWAPLTTFPSSNSGLFAKAVSFAPDRRVLAAGWTSPPRLDLIDFSSQPPKTLISTDKAAVYHPHLSFSSDGRRLALASENGPSVDLIEPSTFETTDKLEGTDRIESIAWSPGRVQVASGHRDGTIHLWKLDEKNDKEHDVFRGHETVVASVDFGSAGKVLASGDWDGKLILWNVQTKQRLKTWTMPGRIWQIRFAPDGRHLAVADGSGAVYILRLK